MGAVALCLILLCVWAGPSAAHNPPVGADSSVSYPAVAAVLDSAQPLAASRPATPKSGAAITGWTTGLSPMQHVYLTLLAAGLALVFKIVSDTVGFLIRRNERHHTAIAKVERTLNYLHARMQENALLIGGIRDAISKKEIFGHFPAPLVLDEQIFEDIYNRPLMNDLARLHVYLDSLTRAMRALEATYLKFRDHYIGDPRAAANYHEYASGIPKELDTLERLIGGGRSQLRMALAKVRRLGKTDRPITARLTEWLLRSADVPNEEVEAELKLMDAELEVSKQRFRKDASTAT